MAKKKTPNINIFEPFEGKVDDEKPATKPLEDSPIKAAHINQRPVDKDELRDDITPEQQAIIDMNRQWFGYKRGGRR